MLALAPQSPSPPTIGCGGLTSHATHETRFLMDGVESRTSQEAHEQDPDHRGHHGALIGWAHVQKEGKKRRWLWAKRTSRQLTRRVRLATFQHAYPHLVALGIMPEVSLPFPALLPPLNR